jgi:hypothetical protein
LESEPEKTYERAEDKKSGPLDLIIRVWQHESNPPQAFVPFERKGFTVVEWGGSEVRF